MELDPHLAGLNDDGKSGHMGELLAQLFGGFEYRPKCGFELCIARDARMLACGMALFGNRLTQSIPDLVHSSVAFFEAGTQCAAPTLCRTVAVGEGAL